MTARHRGEVWAQPLRMGGIVAANVRAGTARHVLTPIDKKTSKVSRGGWQQLLMTPPWRAMPNHTMAARSLFEGVSKPVTIRSIFVPEQLLWIDDGSAAAHMMRQRAPCLWVTSVEPLDLAGLWVWQLRFHLIQHSVEVALRDAKSGLLHHWLPK